MLSDRELTILKHIIESFIETGQPVGSRTLERSYDIGLSSATIRNVMMDLEDMGLISKTHHSSGRIPSGTAIENYVRDLIREKNERKKSKKSYAIDALDAEGTRLKEAMQRASKVLNEITRYASLAIVSHNEKRSLKDIFVRRVDSDNLLFVVITDDGTPFSRLVNDSNLDEEKFNNFLSHYFKGESLTYFLQNLEFLYKKEFGKKIESIFEIKKMIENNEDDELILNGITKLLNHPDFEKIHDIKQVISVLEDKSEIKDLILGDFDTGIKVYIGGDNEALKNLSIITSNYIQNGQMASFGIIAPIRMDYKKVIEEIINIDNAFKHLEDY